MSHTLSRETWPAADSPKSVGYFCGALDNSAGQDQAQANAQAKAAAIDFLRNDISNLWPELAEPQPGFHQKDKVENYLHDLVCNGNLTLAEAQRQIATNWLAVYDQMPNK